jgi:hypothetical protein
MSSKSSSKLFSNSRLALASLRGMTAFAWLQGLVLAALIAIAAPAQATPMNVFFDGNRPAGDPTTAFGISVSSAINARDNFGVPILTSVDLMTRVTGRLSVTLPPYSSLVINPNPPTSPLNTATSNWQIENISGSALRGASYVLFTHTDPYAVGNRTVDYPDANVGLRIDASEGWVIIRGQSQGIDYYYPALLLDRAAQNPIDGNIAAGARVSAAIHYVVNQPLIGFRNNGRTDYYLPELQLGFAQVVPEPGTALLLGFGLTILAAQRKRA